MNKKQQLSLWSIVGLFACGVAALGFEDSPQSKGPNYLEPAGPKVGGFQILATANTEEFLPDDFNGTSYLCLPYGSQIEFGMSVGDGPVCFTHTASVSNTANANAEDATALTDAEGPDGDGPCVYMWAGDRLNQVPSWEQMRGAVGHRRGICDKGKVAYRGGPLVYPPCGKDTDCTLNHGLSGATCDLSPDAEKQRKQSCTMILVGGDTNSTEFHWRVEK